MRNASHRRENMQHLVLLALAFLLPLGLAFRRFPYFGDPVVDFGSELYIPWRLNEGETLYRDLGYYYGPLSPYFNALLFRLFGVHRSVLLAANAGVYLCSLGFLALLLRRLFPLRTVAASLFLVTLLFGFDQLSILPNYSFLAPYRHGLTHGFLLSLVTLWLAWRGYDQLGLPARISKKASWYFAAAGFTFGLTGLTKLEVFLALGAGLLPLFFRLGLEKRSFLLRASLSFLPAFLLPWAAAFLSYVGPLGFTAAEAWGWLKFPFTLAANEKVRALKLYHGSVENLTLATLLQWAQTLAFTLLVLGGLWLLLRRQGKKAGQKEGFAVVGVVAFAVPFSCWLWPWLPVALGEVFQLAPLAAGTAGLFFLAACSRKKNRQSAFPASFLLFAFVLSWKLFSAFSLSEAGFVLGLPAVLALFLLVFEGVPAWMASRGPWQMIVLLLLVPQVYVIQATTESTQATMEVSLTSARGEFRYFRLKAAIIGELFTFLKGQFPEAKTVTFLPEGAGLNFYLQKPTPSHYMNFLPDHYLHFGEAEMTGTLARRPADLIVILPRGTEEFGEAAGDFRTGFGARTYQWIRENYARTASVPELLTRFGVEVYRLGEEERLLAGHEGKKEGAPGKAPPHKQN